MPPATVVVPVLNGAAHLPSLLEALQAQQPAVELLAIDSGSTDASVEMLERARVRLLRIPRTAFDHGQTRNLGAREARGEVVVFLTQDALPRDAGFVGRLIRALSQDARIAGAFARQVPRPEADPITRRDLAAWAAAGEEPRTVFVGGEAQLSALSPLERLHLMAFDNVASAVRRSVLLEHPFAAARFGEDVEWSVRVLRLGYGIAYAPDAVVIHSHRRAAGTLFRRNYLCHRALFRIFGLRTMPDLPHLARGLVGSLGSDLHTLARHHGRASQWLGAPAQAIAATCGQYLGARDEARGRPYPLWARRT